MAAIAPTPAERRRRALLRTAAVAAFATLTVGGLTVAPLAPSAAVAATASTLSLQSGALESGADIVARYTTDDPHAKNWIGVYPADQVPGPTPSLQWGYTPDASGEVTLDIELPAGEYRVWYLSRDGYTPLTEPAALTVTAAPEAPVPGDPSTPVEIDPVATTIGTDGVIARFGFDDGALPEGWTVESATTGWAGTTRADWVAGLDEMRDRFGRAHEGILVADAARGGATTLTSAPVDVAGLASARLTFDSHYRGSAGQSGVVRVAFDGGAPQELLRLDSASVVDGYDETQMNGAQDLVVAVPEGAREAVFSWDFAPGEQARYWAIDSVAVHRVQTAATGAPTTAWVVSDIQGHPADLQHGLGDFHAISPDPAGLLMVGDIVNSGTVREWDEVYAVMDATEGIRPATTVAAIGNHERYAAGGFDANRQRFLDFAERDGVWYEQVLEGPGGDLPVIVLGQEFAGPSDVAMSEAQVRFLEQRLAHWTALDQQVAVITHFPLGNTVSASWHPGYSTHHQHNDRLTSILGNYPNAIVLTGHTHYPAEQGDWAMQRRTADGHPDGFTAINTVGMHVEWDAVGETTASRREVTTGDMNRGLTVERYDDRVVVTAYDFAASSAAGYEQLRQVTVPNPLVAFDAELAPVVEPSPEPSSPEPVPSQEPSQQPAPAASQQPGVSTAAEDSSAGARTGSLSRTGLDGSSAAVLAAVAGGVLALGTALVLRARRVRRGSAE